MDKKEWLQRCGGLRREIEAEFQASGPSARAAADVVLGKLNEAMHWAADAFDASDRIEGDDGGGEEVKEADADAPPPKDVA